MTKVHARTPPPPELEALSAALPDAGLAPEPREALEEVRAEQGGWHVLADPTTGHVVDLLLAPPPPDGAAAAAAAAASLPWDAPPLARTPPHGLGGRGLQAGDRHAQKRVPARTPVAVLLFGPLAYVGASPLP
jgi:hypothetical protein